MSLVTTLLADQGSRSPVRSEGSWTFSPIPLLMLGVVRIYVATTTGVKLRVSPPLAWGFEACQSYSHNPLAMIGVVRIDVATTTSQSGLAWLGSAWRARARRWLGLAEPAEPRWLS